LLVLFTTAGCHLCDDAEAILRYCRSYYPQVQWRTVEIAEDAALVERYGVRIPVISMADSEAELSWPFDPGQLMAFIKSQINDGH
jgi:hypothetical protein